jgi:hypothetical protein
MGWEASMRYVSRYLSEGDVVCFGCYLLEVVEAVARYAQVPLCCQGHSALTLSLKGQPQRLIWCGPLKSRVILDVILVACCESWAPILRNTRFVNYPARKSAKADNATKAWNKGKVRLTSMVGRDITRKHREP